MLTNVNKIVFSLILILSLILDGERGFADIVNDIGELDQPPKNNETVKPTGSKGKEALERETRDKSDREETNPKHGDSKPKVSAAWEQRPSGKNQRRQMPIHLQSEGTSTYSQNGSLVYLQKNVIIIQDDVRIQSDEAKVKLGQTKDQNTVNSVEMKGRVNLNKYSKDPTERLTAKGDKALFDNQDQVVTLEGNARLWRDGHLIRGDKIIYEILTGLVKVDRVQGVVQPEKAKQ